MFAQAISLKMQIADIGGSMVIHVFGAFFGLAASKVLTPKSARGNRDNSAVYHADIFSMIGTEAYYILPYTILFFILYSRFFIPGTVFLWIFWPSFNAALSEGNNQQRAVVNTVLSLTASVMFAFIFSQFWRREKVGNTSAFSLFSYSHQ
jgi:ammonium transporter Rh